ncbi:unnamed protein product [Periconia digitata]|uniref:Uncharacterized protein n=1 Tax=Periconia digitata TaxID=1303443 RepID=A0A9W4XDB9_9PLEO|nr:unnamed protein product [Periconia digitata]
MARAVGPQPDSSSPSIHPSITLFSVACLVVLCFFFFFLSRSSLSALTNKYDICGVEDPNRSRCWDPTLGRCSSWALGQGVTSSLVPSNETLTHTHTGRELRDE